ncbi:hypothetical protein AB0H63_06945 [Micromonospora echinospora]|uniref:hypothetical protein n=1 Tax=Micromonospora echinospora TaxID=1877 RepID=UPI0033F38CA8
MTAPFLSLTQILNRLTLTARTILRHHQAEPGGQCRACRVPDCSVATAARNLIRAAEEVQRRSTATEPTTLDPDDPEQAG